MSNFREPKKGDRYLCIKDLVMDSGDVRYNKGVFYKSESDGCITNNVGNKYHSWYGSDGDSLFNETFKLVESFVNMDSKSAREVAVNQLSQVREVQMIEQEIARAAIDGVFYLRINCDELRIKEGQIAPIVSYLRAKGFGVINTISRFIEISW